MPLSKVVLASSFLGLCVVAFAQEANCWIAAGERYGVSPELLYTIARVESGLNPKAIGPLNSNGTRDYGIMQINEMHLPELAKHGIRKEDLLDPCTNINVGAWVLAGMVKRYGQTWESVGAYNAKSKEKRELYVGKVWKEWNRVYQERYGVGFVGDKDKRGSKVSLAAPATGNPAATNQSNRVGVVRTESASQRSEEQPRLVIVGRRYGGYVSD